MARGGTRRIREWLALSTAIALIPWTIYLHWQAVFIIATATFGFARHHLLTLFAFATGVLLVCDA